ncbi:MAG: PAS domain S-box protein [Haloarculaceae archaeon]
MGETAGPPVEIAYLDPTGSEAATALESAAADLSVAHVSTTADATDRAASVDALVVAHGADHADGFAVLAALAAAEASCPALFLTDEDVARRALDAGAADLVRGDPTAPPQALLAHRVRQVVGADPADRPGFTEHVLNTLSDVVYVLDVDGQFRQWNDELPAVTGYDEREIAEMALTDLVEAGDRPAVAEAIDSAREEGTTETREASLVTAVGDRRTYEFKVTPLVDEAVFGFAGTAREVTERKLREQRLAVLTRVLRHNVRNQMTVVQGRAERLAERLADEPDVDAIERAAADLVELSDKARRVGAALRESSANRRPLNVTEIIATTVAALNREFPDADLELSCPEGVEARTTEGLTFAVEELVRNGIEHNDGDPPRVAVRVERERTDGVGRANGRAPGTVAVTVADDGPGLPETEEVALTAGTETDLDHATGLGLWLVNWVTTAAGGELTCEDSEFGGTAVTLRFPAAGE